jgi:hypothetical protein
MKTLELEIDSYNNALENLISPDDYKIVEKTKRSIISILEQDLEQCDFKRDIMSRLHTNNFIYL